MTADLNDVSIKEVSESFYTFILDRIKLTTDCVDNGKGKFMHRILADVVSYFERIPDWKEEYDNAQALMKLTMPLINDNEKNPELIELLVRVRAEIIGGFARRNILFSKAAKIKDGGVSYVRP